MYDRKTFTLWGNLTGEPVAGKLAGGNTRLKMLPMTLTSWSEWRKMHPATKVLHLTDEHGARWGYRYQPGLADRARANVKFPVWQKSKILDDKEEVYVLRVRGIAKAYRIQSLTGKRVLNDQVGQTPVVLILDQDGDAIRVYERGSQTFSQDLKDETGRKWILREDALVSDQHQLHRIPGHIALWFAWYGFFPHTEIYR